MSEHWAGRTGLRPGAAGFSALGITALVITGSVGYAEVYGGAGWMMAAIGGALIGGLVSYLVALRRWSGSAAVSISVVAYLLFGAVLATPGLAVAGFFPSIESLRRLSSGVLTSWRDMLTVTVPIGTTGGLLIPVYLTALASAGIGTWLSIRSGRPIWALVAPAANLGICALLGGEIGRWSLAAGVITGVGGLIWASWRTRTAAGFQGAGLDLRRPVSAALVLLAGVTAAFWVGPVMTGDEPRHALRDSFVVPLDPKVYPSPLGGFRSYVRDRMAAPLFSVTDLPAGQPIRLATLDDYNGVVFRVSADNGTFDRVGDQIGPPAEDSAGAVDVDFAIEDYNDVWLPTAGQVSGITFTGSRALSLTENFRYSVGTTTGVVTSGLADGDGYTLSVQVSPQPTAQELAGQGAGQSGAGSASRIPDAVKAAALEITSGQSTAYGKVEAVQAALIAAGALSHGDTQTGELVSPAGHGLDRLTRLVAQVPMIGDQEQFAPAMALMLRSLGLPARVVMGFAPPETYDGTGTLVVTGAAVTAWTEVNFATSGWVAFQATPLTGQIPPEPEPDPALTPRKQILQPPPPPEVPEEANASDITDEGADPEDIQDPATVGSTGANLWFLAWGVGAPLVLLGLPLLLILGLKERRRSARRTAPEPADRVSGAWREILDTAIDFGSTIPKQATRTEAAALLDAEFGTSSVALAKRADALVFGSVPVDSVAATAFWVAVNGAMVRMRSSRKPSRRWRAKLSPASLKAKGSLYGP